MLRRETTIEHLQLKVDGQQVNIQVSSSTDTFWGSNDHNHTLHERGLILSKQGQYSQLPSRSGGAKYQVVALHAKSSSGLVVT